MIVRILLIVPLVMAAAAPAFPSSRASFGLDMTRLFWQDEEDVFWSFHFARGPMLWRDLYLRVRISMPVPGFVIIGNQFKAGSELLYDLVP